MAQAFNTCLSPRSQSQLQCRVHGALGDWLASSGGSLAITTYTSGKLVLVSSIGRRVCFRVKPFARPMGLAVEGNRLALATQDELLLFRNSGALVRKRREKQPSSECDAVWAPHVQYATGKLNTHDVAWGRRGLYFANTRFNCIARPTKRCQFVHHWQPSFVSGTISEDRCHLNGLAVKDGYPAMATAFCETGHTGSWRELNRWTHGVVVDVPQNTVVVRGLCMPHSPRFHEGQWWLCNSGHGSLCTFDPTTGRFEEFCSLPGFARGLCLVNDFALVGLSKIRKKHILTAPPVRKRHPKIRAGVALVDLNTGCEVGSLEFVRGGNEVYDVAFMPGIREPDLYAPTNASRNATIATEKPVGSCPS